MANEIEVRIKQDFIILKPQEALLETRPEGIVFVDKTDSKLKYRDIDNGATHVISLKNPAEEEALALMIQEQIAQLTSETAKAGENTDIVSLGTPGQSLQVRGQLHIQQPSSFHIYNSIEENTLNPTRLQQQQFNKILLDSVVSDVYQQIVGSRFTAKIGGVYVVNGSVAVAKDATSPDWRIIVSVYKNGQEFARGNDISLALPHGGGGVSTTVLLNVGDYLELFCYTLYNCRLYAGAAITAFKGIKIA